MNGKPFYEAQFTPEERRRLKAAGYVPSTNRDDIYFLDVPAYRNRIIVKKADDGFYGGFLYRNSVYESGKDLETVLWKLQILLRRTWLDGRKMSWQNADWLKKQGFEKRDHWYTLHDPVCGVRYEIGRHQTPEGYFWGIADYGAESALLAEGTSLKTILERLKADVLEQLKKKGEEER